MPLPYWVKVTRSGSTITSYASSDGVTWVQLGTTQTVSIATNVYVGLAVTSGSTSQWLSTTQAADRMPHPQEPLSEERLPLAQTDQAQSTGKRRFRLRPAEKWAGALALAATLTIAVFAYRSAHRLAVHASATSAPASGTRDFRKPATAEAEDFYLKGRYYWNKRTSDDLNRAVDFFTQAIVRDPGYAKAYVGLADSYNLLREYSAMPASEAYPRALAAATKAVELDDFSAEAHTSLAFVTYFWSWDAAVAEHEFKRALDLNPNDARTHHWYATFLLACGRLPEALTQIEVARRLDPSSVAILADKGEILHTAGQMDEAIGLLKQMEAAEPSFTSPHRYLSEIYFDRKDYSAYLSEWEKTVLLLHDEQELAVVKAAEKGLSKDGYKGMLEGMLRVQRTLNQKGALPAYTVAATCARLGRKQDALQYLKTAYDKHDSSVLFLSIDSAFESLHDDPEYKDLVARVTAHAKPIPRTHDLANQE